MDVDVRKGRYRNDNWIGLQEAFIESRLPYESHNFDFTSIRAGIQPFQADFKGFLYSDNSLALRLFGNKDNNRIQCNLAWFHQLEKDTNSGLNSYTLRNQDIFIANVFFQDSLKYFRNHSTNPKLLGLTTEFTFADQHRQRGQRTDPEGRQRLHRSARSRSGRFMRKMFARITWALARTGISGDTTFRRSSTRCSGPRAYNAIAGRGTNINAQFFSIELSYDQDWIRYRASFAYASGDHDPTDGNANGFDSIFDNPNFAGGGLNFFTRQAIALTGAGVNLVQAQ